MIGNLVAGQTGSGGASLSSYESIATATGTGSSGTITFSSIPSTFKHLQIRFRVIPASNTYLKVNFNGVSGTSYATHSLIGDGASTAASGTASTSEFYAAGIFSYLSTTYPNVGIIDILDYGSTTKNKTARIVGGFDANGSGEIDILSGLFNSTNAITSIAIACTTGNFATTTTIDLYGIKEA